MSEIQKKSVRFDHLEPTYTTYSNTTGSKTYDLEELLKRIVKVDPLETKKDINGDSYVFHVCKYHDEDKLWELRVLRIREKVLPGILHEDGKYDLIKLGNNEVPAESTTLAYSPETHTLYMQRNRFGISIRNMEAYLSELSPEGTIVILAVKETGTGLLRMTSDVRYRKVIMVAETNPLEELSTQSTLRDILTPMKKVGGQYCNVEIKVGRGKHATLDAEQAIAFVKEAYDYSGIDKLNVVIEDEDDKEVETIDLLSNAAKYTVPFSYSMANPITHERLYFALKSKILEN